MWPELFLNESTLFMWEFGVKVGDSTGSSQLPHYQTPPVQTHNTSQTLKLNRTFFAVFLHIYLLLFTPCQLCGASLRQFVLCINSFFCNYSSCIYNRLRMTKELRSYIWMSCSVRQGLCLINASTASLFSSLLSFFFFFTIFLICLVLTCQQGEWKICLTMLFSAGFLCYF